MPIFNIKWFTCNLAIVLVEFSWLLAPPQLSAETTCLQFEGILDFTRAPIRKSEEHKERFIFRVVMQEQSWNIRMIPVNANKTAVPFCEIGCDGTTMYAYNEHNPDSDPPKDTNGAPIRANNGGTAMVIPDNVPNPLINRCESLWLAFCSTWYFSTNTLQQARQIWLSGDVTSSVLFTNISVKASWELLPKGKRFLAKIEYYPGIPTPQEYPLVVYRTLRTKELENLEVPTEFEYIRFNEIEPQNKVAFETYYCQVTNVHSVSQLDDIKPKISVPVIMLDYRFSQNSPALPVFRQLVTNGVWQEKGDAIASKQFKIQKRVAALQAAKKPLTLARKIIIGFFIANALVFGFVMMKDRKKRLK